MYCTADKLEKLLLSGSFPGSPPDTKAVVLACLPGMYEDCFVRTEVCRHYRTGRHRSPDDRPLHTAIPFQNKNFSNSYDT